MATQVSRRSDRIAVMMPLEVEWKDAEGREFAQKTRTLEVSRRGAIIILPDKLAPKQELLIRCPGGRRQEVVRVLRQTGRHAEGLVYRVAAVNSGADLWDIEFPALTESEKAFVQALLECGRCQGCEVACLNEIEFKAFVADQALGRYCKSCGASTTWKPVTFEGPAETSAAPLGIVPRTEDKRKEARARVNLLACVRESGNDEEVAVCENISHGGLCIRGKKRYREGAKVEVAVPYSPRSASVFAPAWVVYSREASRGDLFRSGLTYKSPKSKLKI